MDNPAKWTDVTKHNIYVGLNDSEAKEQLHQTEKFYKILTNICRGYHIAFSVSELQGGYFHENDAFVSEKSFCLTLVGADDRVVDEISKDLCAFFNQESVLVTREKLDCRFVSEKIE